MSCVRWSLCTQHTSVGLFTSRWTPRHRVHGWRSPQKAAMMRALSSAQCEPLLAEAVHVQGSAAGILRGKTFVSKDIFDVKGFRTGFGNPTWLSTHPPAAAHAPVVQALLDAGATLVGKAHMDELAYSLNGKNPHYGTPPNPAAPERIPGGSSSGSASAVASGLADIGLGTDTGGSVRIPASYCGLLGIRPTHGRVSLEGACLLSPSYDTAGWFTRDAATLAAVGEVLLPASSRSNKPLTKLTVATDAFDLADKATAQALYNSLSCQIHVLTEILGQPQEVRITQGLEGGLQNFDEWFKIFRITQAAQVWPLHKDWITKHQPDFGSGLKERLQMAAGINEEEAETCRQLRSRIASHLKDVLASTVLLIPSAPGPAPLLSTPDALLEDWRQRVITLTCIAGLAGLPQVNLPITTVEGAPVGLGLIGPSGCDEQLLAISAQLMSALQTSNTRS